jgi:hypothetical protein
MPFTCKVGDSFYLADSGGHHRYVIITKPNSDGNIVLGPKIQGSSSSREPQLVMAMRDSLTPQG